MRKKLAALLHKLADWLHSEIPVELLRAKVLVKEMEQRLGTTGEYKRHQVYAQLIKEFPTVSKRFLSMQIEKALQ